jgi:outer membrane protein OmpA-like peptidoglycan-associated protein
MTSSLKLITVLLVCASVLMMGCGASNTVKGGGIGAAAGGVLGAIIGHAAGNTAAGVIIGAAVGGAAGALIGNYMDRQAAEMKEDLKNARVERVGEGIKITFDSGILFNTNSSDLQPQAKTNLESLAKILNKYPDTNILVDGHTDSTGTAEYNQRLSERRASSVSDYLKGLAVAGSRIAPRGFGETAPVTSNATAEGRQQNRRVEVAIFANDKLKDAAMNNKLE